MKMMRLVLALGALVLALEGWGQGWLKIYGESPGYCGNADWLTYPPVIATTDGNYALLSGVSSGSILSKVSPNGGLLWEKNLDFGLDVTAHSDGGYAITGNIPSQVIPLTKLASDGTLLWTKTYNPVPNAQFQWGRKVLETADGGFVIAAQISFAADYGILLKTDADGNLQWTKEFNPNGFGLNLIFDLIHTSDGGFAFAGYRADNTNRGFLTKTDENGNTEWDININTGICTGLAQLPDNSFIVTGNISSGGTLAAKIDESGSIVWEKDITYASPASLLSGEVTIGADGLPCIIRSTFFPGNNDLQILIIKIDDNGNEVWLRRHGFFGVNEYGTSILPQPNGGYLLAGARKIAGNCSGNILISIDSLGLLYSSAITGSVHLDPQSDCLPDPTEPALANWLVQATGNYSFATLTDAGGHFTLPVDTGSYQVTVTPPGPYWDVCNSPASVTISAFYDTLALEFPVQADEECPYLEVDISAPFLRRCFDNNYAVHYCNYGTVMAEDAYVEVTLDPYLTYQSSTIPFSNQNGNTLTFDLGDVAVNECGDFQITAYLDCDSTVLGQTHCTEAHIFPDSLCILTNTAWDGSSIEVDVECAGDSVVFIITNTGTGNMAQPLDYIIIEDQIVLLQGDFQLNSGQTTTVTVPANGATFHLEAQQSPEHPSGTASVGATIEGCGGWMSLGFFIQWPTNNPNPFVDVDCQPNIGSFDPNDKTAFPEGFTEQHLIEPGTDIEYLLRFQNTGTDTAFKVVVADVLPPELDLATVRPGASSHPYTYSISPEGRLVFTFENILLPDSTTNEPGSHGFVRFRVSQVPGLDWGNQIANSALIYFDFNAPIQTNTTIHRIGQIFPWTLVGTTPPVFSPKSQIRILPNPLTDSALLQVEGIEPGHLRLVLTNMTGQVLREERTFGTGLEFRRGELASGVYFFKIERDGKWIGSGKLMVR